MYQIILFIYVFVAVCIVALVLVQQGKGATMGAAFGSGASQTVFGSRGSGSFLFRVTMTLAAIFFISAIAMNYLVMHAYKQEQAIVVPTPAQQIPIKNTSTAAPNSVIPPASATQPVSPTELPTRSSTGK